MHDVIRRIDYASIASECTRGAADEHFDNCEFKRRETGLRCHPSVTVVNKMTEKTKGKQAKAPWGKMEKSNSSANCDRPIGSEQGEASEEDYIELYIELSGASEAQARSVYMYSDIIRQRDPYCYRFV